MKKILPFLMLVILITGCTKKELKVAKPEDIKIEENTTTQVQESKEEEKEEINEMVETVENDTQDPDNLKAEVAPGVFIDYNKYFQYDMPDEKELEILNKVLSTKPIFHIDGKEFSIPFSLDDVKANFDIVKDDVETDPNIPMTLHKMVDSNGKKFDGIYDNETNMVENWRWHYTDYPVTPPFGIEAYESFDTAIDKIDKDLITHINFSDNAKIVHLLMDHSKIKLYFPDDGGLVMFDASLISDTDIGAEIKDRDIKWKKELIDYKKNK